MADNTHTEESADREEKSFLSRWSRQKLAGSQHAEQTTKPGDNDSSAVNAVEDAASGPADVAARSEKHPENHPDKPPASDSEADRPEQLTQDSPASNAEDSTLQEPSEQEPVLTDADMPALDTLSSSSDYSAFFSKGVSKELRQQALRHLFSHAKFNIRDGLNDYDEDYTTFEPLGDTVTSDMRWHKARKEREEKERLEAEALAKQSQEELEQQQLEGTVAEESTEDSEQDPVATENEDLAQEPQNNDAATEVAKDEVDASVSGMNAKPVAETDAETDKPLNGDSSGENVATTHDEIEGA